jgi:hypothetical protein
MACDRRWLVVLSIALCSCGGDERPDEVVTGASSITLGSATETPVDPSGSDAPDDDGDGDGGEKLDVPAGTGTGNGGDISSDACEKVDLLFVIDSSGSMQDEQANLVAAFPDFIATMRSELAETEGYNVGVIRTDANDISCVPNRYGVLVTRNFAAGSSMNTCTPYASGARYMTQDDDLAEKFSCAARVGIGGDGDERPAQALVAALSSPNTDTGECNEGFLRDDALLVVVIISDEEDDHETAAEACDQEPLPGSDGEPTDWFDSVVAAKGGIETNVVVLSLVGPEGADACPALDKCNGGIEGAEPAPRLVAFTEMFTHGFVGRVCGDYDPFFQEAIATIESACNDFTPPG